jgi:hypothetical protein
MSVSVGEWYNSSVYIHLPDFANVLTKLSASCIDPNTNKPFCHIGSAKIRQAGRNVDGFMTEYTLGGLQPVYSNKSVNFYNDQMTWDLGIITNTSKDSLFGFE